VPGFASRVACTAEQLAAGFAEIRDLAPNITVIVERSLHFEQILPTLPLGQLYGLALPAIANGFLRRLESVLRGVARLELSGVYWSPSPEKIVETLEHVESLVELALDCERPSDAYLQAIVNSPHAGRLGVLEIDEPLDLNLRDLAVRAFAGRTLTFARKH
jgi:hypothetical protein